MSDNTGRGRSYLLMCDNWSATQGGVPSFNRMLATGCVLAGHRVACLVKQPSREELQDARDRGVVLLAAGRNPTGPDLLIPTAEVDAFGADVVVGHDRFSGPAAWTYARRRELPGLVHIFHTAVAQNERYKRSEGATRLAEEREQINRSIAADAVVVAAVGPLLTRYARDLIEDGTGSGRSVLDLTPGIEPIRLPERRLPARRHVLLLGRTDDITLKGLDIAARAVAGLPHLGVGDPSLLVRGAPEAECDALHSWLVGHSGLARDRVDVRPYTTDAGELSRDMVRSSLCIMPSRFEGFGLVAFDAIAHGTPLLVSNKSGVAALLSAELGRMAAPMIVVTQDEIEADVAHWKNAITSILADLPAAFDYAREVQARLVPKLDWRTTAQQLDDAVTRSLQPT